MAERKSAKQLQIDEVDQKTTFKIKRKTFNRY